MKTLTTCSAAVLITSAVAASTAGAQQVWSGLDVTFEKPPSADWSQEENQDRITDNVWITRQDLEGLFNIALESSYTEDLSPMDTEWATGLAVNWPSLTFATWEAWLGPMQPPPLGVNAVVHLITDDIYIDIRFDSWSVGAFGGGGFAYSRGADPVPIETSTWAAIKSRFD